MTNTAKLKELLITKGSLNWIEFDNAAGDVLEEHGYTDDDLSNMSVDDVRDVIAELFNMALEERDDSVYVVNA